MDLNKLKEIQIEDLREIDLSEAAEWPLAGRVVVMAVIIIAVLGAGYWFHVKDQLERLEGMERQEQDLRQQFESRQERAANLDDYKEQLEEMRESFGTMLQQLPGEAEVPALLQDISETALANGLESDVFEPTGERERDFYAELPYRMRLYGSYHEFGQFTDDVARLPRIVTLHDFRIRPQGNGQLQVELVAKTYRYLGEEEGGN